MNYRHCTICHTDDTTTTGHSCGGTPTPCRSTCNSSTKLSVNKYQKLLDYIRQLEADLILERKKRKEAVKQANFWVKDNATGGWIDNLRTSLRLAQDDADRLAEALKEVYLYAKDVVEANYSSSYKSKIADNAIALHNEMMRKENGK